MTAVRPRWLRVLDLVIVAGSAIYVAARFSEKGGFVNVGFYLPLSAFVVVVVATRGRALVDLFASRLGMATIAFALGTLYAVAITPDRGEAWRSFLPAHGRMFLTALFIGYAASRASYARLLLWAFIGGAAASIGRQVATHVEVWQLSGGWIPSYHTPEFLRIRPLGEAHALYLPALVAIIAVVPARPWRLGLAAIVVIEALLLVPTGFRGAWLAVVAASVLVAALAGKWRALAALAVVGFLAIGAALTTLPDAGRIVAERFQRLDTGRADTWGPAIDMVRERPLAGHGYGQELYHRTYAAEALARDWVLKESGGAHNMYLSTAFASGIFGLAALVWLYVEMARAFIAAFRRSAGWEPKALALAGFAALFGPYVVHGAFEDKLWPVLGIPLGLALGFDAMRRVMGRTDAFPEKPN
ncbi:MAG: O-antigen ligase family protein [Burkholderiales bacterium]|nr:O-antigen ligase family protein [Burkholderiales bacterium]